MIILLSTVHLSIPAFFGGRATSRSSTFVITTSCAVLLCVLFPKPLCRRLSLSHSHPVLLDWRKCSPKGWKLTELPAILASSTSQPLCFNYVIPPCSVVESKHSVNKQWCHQVETSSRLLSLCLKRHCKGQKIPILLLQVEKMKFIKDGLGRSIKRNCVESGRYALALSERICRLNHDEDVLFRRSVEARVIKERYAEKNWLWTVLSSLARRKNTSWCLIVILTSPM